MVLVCVDTLGPPGFACAQASQALHLGGRARLGNAAASLLERSSQFQRVPGRARHISSCAALQPHAIDAPRRERWARRATNKWPSARSRTSSANWCSTPPASLSNSHLHTPSRRCRATERALTSAQIPNNEDSIRRGTRNQSGKARQGPREARPRCVIPPGPTYEARAH